MRIGLHLSTWLLGLGLAHTAAAGLVDSITVGYSPRTGDTWVDTQLGDINVFARGNMDGFVDDIAVTYGAPRYWVRELAFERAWPPGDIQMACALARQLGWSCRDVVDRYGRDRGQGWGVIAQRMGIKPGSPAFHALKGQIGKTHGKFKAQGQGQGRPVQSPYSPRNPDVPGKPDHAGGKGKGKDKDKGGGH